MQIQFMAEKAEKFKPTGFRIYLSAVEVEQLAKVCERTELGHSELLTKLSKAALRAIVENGSRITLPLRFALIDPDKFGPIILREDSAGPVLSSPAPKKKPGNG